MYIFKNALKSISRSKGRNILIGIIVLVIAISTCVALSIREAANTAKEETLKNLKITAQISIDRESLMKNASTTDRASLRKAMQSIKELTVSQLQEYAKAESVKSFYYTIKTSMDAGSGIESVDTTSSSTASSTNSTSGSSSQNSANSNSTNSENKDRMGFGMGSQGDFTIIGYSSDAAMTSFVDGTSTIKSGKIFAEGTSNNDCVISDELATYNSLKVGDTITLVNPNKDSETVTLNIVGIYHNDSSTTTSSDQMGGFRAASDPANQIYMSYNAVKSITDTSSKNATTTTDSTTGMTKTDALRAQVSGTYTFASISDYNKFEKEAKALGLSDSYTVTSQDVNTYEQSLQPLENLSKYALYFLIVVLIIGAIILVVLNIFNIRERKYEIGVLAAIGMKKGKIALQFITEIFVVTILAIIVGTGIGAAISVPVTNSLLESQVSTQQTQSQQIDNNFGRQSAGGQGGPNSGYGRISQYSKSNGGFMGSTVNYVSSVKSATDMKVVLELMGIGIILTLISSCVAVIFVLRYDPLKILSNRD